MGRRSRCFREDEGEDVSVWGAALSKDKEAVYSVRILSFTLKDQFDPVSDWTLTSLMSLKAT